MARPQTTQRTRRPSASSGGDRHADQLAALNAALTAVSRRTRARALHQRMAKAAGVDIRTYLLDVLFRVRGMQPARVSDVADGMGYDRSTISRHVAELVESGFLTRERDAVDGRAVIVKLSPAGKRAIARIEKRWFETLDQITSEWTDGDRSTLIDLLTRFDDDFTQVLGALVD